MLRPFSTAGRAAIACFGVAPCNRPALLKWGAAPTVPVCAKEKVMANRSDDNRSNGNQDRGEMQPYGRMRGETDRHLRDSGEDMRRRPAGGRVPRADW